MIQIVGYEPMDEQMQWIYMTIPIEGSLYQFTHVAPANLNGDPLEAYVNQREEFYRQEIIAYLYPYAKMFDQNGNEVVQNIPWLSSDEMLAWAKERNLAPRVLPSHPELVPGSPKAQLFESDFDMIRVVEDIWAVLKNKGLVTDNDLPMATRNKLTARATLRASLRTV